MSAEELSNLLHRASLLQIIDVALIHLSALEPKYQNMRRVITEDRRKTDARFTQLAGHLASPPGCLNDDE